MPDRRSDRARDEGLDRVSGPVVRSLSMQYDTLPTSSQIRVYEDDVLLYEGDVTEPIYVPEKNGLYY